jgi:hypothetical protein
MQFQNQAVTEITVPNNVPFGPGNDVIGIGTALPPELAAYAPIPGGNFVTAAIIFYTAGYNPAGTLPQVKYYWIGVGSASGSNSSLNFGFAIVNNASVSQTAIVLSGFSLLGVNNFAGHITINYLFDNHNDNTIGVVGELNTGGDGAISAVTNAGAQPGGTTATVLIG